MKVKGNILKARVAFVKDNFDDEAWTRVLDAMSEEESRILQGIITNTGWYPFEMAERLDAAIVQLLGGGRSTLFEDLGRVSARKNLEGVHRAMLEPGDPQAFLRKAAMMYTFYYDTGHRTYRETGPTSGVITTYDADTFSTHDCATVIGWYKEALAMCGARSVEIVEEECRSKGGMVCRYQVSWLEPSKSGPVPVLTEVAAPIGLG